MYFQGKWPAQYLMDTAPAQSESPLDMNHSHFILVDNGTQYKFGTEIALRAQLEASISKLKSGFGEFSFLFFLFSVCSAPLVF